jgi:phosphoribosylanthranilate isomerase
MTRVKICGITREDDRHAAVAAGADAVGVVSEVPVDTPREVAPGRAAELVAAVPPFVSSVLVTMPGDPERTVALAEVVAPDVLQVHGSLGAGDVAYLSAKTDATVLKAVAAEEGELARRYADVADALLVDTDEAGGTGRTHDWSRTRELVAALDTPVVLAGGLSPANVGDAVDAVGPFGVDVATGVESEGGVKDHDAVAAFVERAKSRREASHGPRP